MTMKAFFLKYRSLALTFDQETWFKVISHPLPMSTLKQSNGMRLIGLQGEKNNMNKDLHRA